jgi:hypothetical protein
MLGVEKMKTDLSKIKDRALGEMLDVFFVCQKCRIVDNDHGRVEGGHKCTTCNEPSSAGQSYYSAQVFSLITLMQEFYHTHQDIPDDLGEKQDQWWADKTKLPVIIFFTTLRELLLNNFIDELFRARNIGADICERLLKDSPTHKQRLGKLFRALTGEKWEAALKAIDQKEKTDFIRLNKFIMDVVEARNDFVHAGNTWSVKDEMADECIRCLYAMLQLHAYMHNYFVAPLYTLKLATKHEE